MTWPGYERYLPPGRLDSAGRVRGAEKPCEDDAIGFQCRALGLPEPVREHRFHPVRMWKFDWAWPDRLVALEQEGIVYPPKGSGDHRLGGRHASVKGFRGDIEKYGEAFALGWRVLRCLPEQVTSGQAMLWIEPVLRVREGEKTMSDTNESQNDPAKELPRCKECGKPCPHGRDVHVMCAEFRQRISAGGPLD